MSKQILVVALWGYTGWYLGATIAVQFGLPAIVGPLVGVLGAAFIGRTYAWSASGRLRKAVTPTEASVAGAVHEATTVR